MLVLALVVGAAACGSKINVSPGATPASLAETELIARVKTALLNDSIVGLRRIDVHAAGDQIRLTGRVASAAERDRAVQIARDVPGVRAVTPELEIRP
ncbi:MAG TPA: BON domain-containing protein [Vicinamibacterales bacterium]|nr:BON domain-containing protein [Vicinamibacterales bacterium]